MRKLMLTVVVVILQQISSSQLNEFLKTVMEAFHRRSEYLNCLKTVNRPPSNVALTGQTSGGWTSQSPFVVVDFEQSWSFLSALQFHMWEILVAFAGKSYDVITHKGSCGVSGMS